MSAYLAIGRPQVHRTAALIRTGLFIASIYPAVKTFGLLGASFSMLLAMAVSLSVQLLYARRLVKLGLGDYFASWLPGFKMSLFVIVPSLLARFVLDSNSLFALGIGGFLCLSAWGVALARKKFWRRLLISG